MHDNVKRSNIRIIGIPEGKEEQGIENLFETVMMENFPNLMKEKLTNPGNTDFQGRGTQTCPLQDTS